jgi:ABC-type taurine transport system ATPase subunit
MNRAGEPAIPGRAVSGAAAAIEARGVVKSFGSVRALRGVDLTVRAGQMAALLGPNGAGKTTLVRILATLLRPDSGTVTVLGRDVTARPYAVRALIGLTGQYAGLDEALTGTGNLVLIGRLAGLGRREAGRRAAELAERFGLAAASVAAARASLTGRLGPGHLGSANLGSAHFDAADLHADEASRRLTILARDGLTTLLTVARLLRADGIEVADIALRQPSLDETFLALTAGTTMTGATAR